MRIEQVNRVILQLAGRNRDAAVRVLAKFDAQNTPQLRRQDYPSVIAAAEHELAKLERPGEPTPAPSTNPEPERPLYVWCGE